MSVANSSPVVIAKADLDAMGHDIDQLARARVATWGGQSWDAHVRSNNVLGLVGELAVLWYVRQMADPGTEVEWVADREGQVGDVLVRGPGARELRLEVKTTTPGSVRNINKRQLSITTADVYVWCAAVRDEGSTDVALLGWSTTSEVRRSSAPASIGDPFDEARSPRPPERETDGDPGYDYDDDDIGYDEDDPRRRRPVQYPPRVKGAADVTGPWPGSMEPGQALVTVRAKGRPMHELLGSWSSPS